MAQSSKNNSYKKKSNRSYIKTCDKIGLRKLFLAFTNAKYGFITAWKNEAAFRMEVMTISIALFILYFLNVDYILKIVLFILLFVLLIVELLNSSIEILCDFIKDEYNDTIKAIKDIASAAVGLSIIMNIAIWLYAFYKALPYIFIF